MAEKCVESLQPEIGREICLVKGKNGEFLGYKRDILIENLSERENKMFVCIRCQGIMREVCVSSDCEQFCSCCKKEGEQTNLNLPMSNMVLSFKCSCPLIARGCGWLGALGGCQDHLDTCGYVYETCKLRCGVVLQRNELKVHEKENCPQRIVECKHCYEEFKSSDMTKHLDECPKMKVLCELGCGLIMCREDMTQHLEVDCSEKELECPFAKYKCQMGLIKRKNMSKHLEEKRIEHLELKLFVQDATIETMSQEIESLNKKVQHLCCIPIKLEWRITEFPDFKYDIIKTFLVAGYHLEFELCRTYSLGWFRIRVRPLTGWYSEGLKWPFQVKFITRLISNRNPKGTKEFKSEVIVVEKENFNSDSNIRFTIAEISKDDFMRNHSIGGITDIETFAIFL